jgi:alkanesulfonate monooxygenase SsuD/methylene tetrahydromethanopterin reductase-like flavin-dependent oxidoreductase (luciferase family)
MSSMQKPIIVRTGAAVADCDNASPTYFAMAISSLDEASS